MSVKTCSGAVELTVHHAKRWLENRVPVDEIELDMMLALHTLIVAWYGAISAGRGPLYGFASCVDLDQRRAALSLAQRHAAEADRLEAMRGAVVASAASTR